MSMKILMAISIGSSDTLTANITIEQANQLLQMAVEKFKMKSLKNNCFESEKYFAYTGGFPSPHLALDNKSGTTRLHTITTVGELNKLK